MAERLEAIERDIGAACDRAGRDPQSVTLVAVAKTFGPESVREAADLGVRVFGESRIQEARQKIPECPSNIEWHMVGHLQRNKARNAIDLFSMIHSMDSLRILEAAEESCRDAGRTMRVCLEANVSGERSKFGFEPGQLDEALGQSERFRAIEIAGLMTIPPLSSDPESARPFFRRLRELRDRCRSKFGLKLDELSMGMSHDFRVAIEEGATLVRIGTALFGERRRREE